ncbi:hypothetical protein BP00DRAFT_460831 [Aspergillus indologenus CBS 114.80]|uniref:Uncharacterized protein n=1 Tax=Aspergillus indologenus CBS 114.80 TaxID=1450541 RepID=A0A2V5HSD4_9EURO|nr:hypothetical protein BP00DRAFT_460831 [Aspergillus indologenus CBS 114.80]
MGDDRAKMTRQHVCNICKKRFLRREHCLRHRRGRPPSIADTADVLIRHEKRAHGDQYRARPSIWAASAAGSPSNTPEPCHFEARATDRPGTPIQHALTVQDFTRLHAEALSANYLIPVAPIPTQTPFPGCEPMKMPYATPAFSEWTAWSSPRDEDAEWRGMEAEVRKFQDLGWREGRCVMPDLEVAARPDDGPTKTTEAEAIHGLSEDNERVQHSLGPMFDPLWHPLAARRAAVWGYMLDRHHDVLHRAGLANTGDQGSRHDELKLRGANVVSFC